MVLTASGQLMQGVSELEGDSRPSTHASRACNGRRGCTCAMGGAARSAWMTVWQAGVETGAKKCFRNGATDGADCEDGPSQGPNVRQTGLTLDGGH